MKPDRTEMLKLLRFLDLTEEREWDCDDFLAHVAGFIERARAGLPVPPEAQPLLQHLDVCPECLEEYLELCRVLRDEA